ncbi:hypothetical protein [Colwellia piezophila]|uniref:hypothetical protein n=1 Tax=Colwellia piezophila TaxID=211668 RepID=UPI00036713F8|nr:hypothetical protein [Colwellia piezophila]
MSKANLNLQVFTSVIMLSVLISPVSLAVDVDPTRPFGQSGSGSSSLVKRDGGFVLSSIIHGEGIHTAVINGEIYNMFDYVGEYRLTAINSQSIILRSKSKRLKINIFKAKGFKSNVVVNTVAN